MNRVSMTILKLRERERERDEAWEQESESESKGLLKYPGGRAGSNHILCKQFHKHEICDASARG